MKVWLSLLIVAIFVSCASQNAEERDVEEKAKTVQVADPKGLGNTINELIDTSKTLSEAQKKELRDILAKNKERADDLSAQSYKYRAVLIKELLSGKTNEKEVKILKQDIKKVEEQKLKNTFEAVEKISEIVEGHPQNHQFVEHLLLIDHMH
jgi:hypothetical protein